MTTRVSQEQFRTLRVEITGAVAWITLDRPAAGNAITDVLARELALATALVGDADCVACVVVRATGAHFCLGGDLRAFRAAGAETGHGVGRIVPDLHLAISRLLRMRPVTIAAVNGTAAGAGLSLLCATDLAIAAQSARFTVAYTRVGLSPDGGSTWLLPRIVGARRARELIITNRLLSASEALEWGLVNRVVEGVDLDATVSALANGIARGCGPAHAIARSLLLRSSLTDLESQLDAEAHGIVEMASSGDASEGIAALLEKRSPRFPSAAGPATSADGR